MSIRHRRTGFIIVGIATIAVATFVTKNLSADDDDHKKGHKSRHHHGMNADDVFERIDTDGDGVLSKEEFTESFKKHQERMRKMMWKMRKSGHRSRDDGGPKGCRACGRSHEAGKVVHIHNHYYGDNGSHHGRYSDHHRKCGHYKKGESGCERCRKDRRSGHRHHDKDEDEDDDDQAYYQGDPESTELSEFSEFDEHGFLAFGHVDFESLLDEFGYTFQPESDDALDEES